MADYRIGYLGLNHSHRDGYLKSLEQLPVSVEAVYHPDEEYNPESSDRFESTRCYTDYHRLIERETLDAAWVTLPNRDTPDAVHAAIENGVDVFSEKPMARSAAELQDVANAAEGQDVDVCVGYLWRFHPMSLDLLNLADDGVVGDVKAVNARWFASNLDVRLADRPGDYLYDKDASGGGILQWLGCHWLDLIPWLLGGDSIVRVHANLASESPHTDIETNATIEFETESGVLGTLQAGYLLREGYDTEISLYGSDGTTKSHRRGPTTPDGKSELFIDTDATEEFQFPQRTIEYVDPEKKGYFGQIGMTYFETFLEGSSSKQYEHLATLEDAIKVLSVLDAIYRSNTTESWVQVDR